MSYSFVVKYEIRYRKILRISRGKFTYAKTSVTLCFSRNVEAFRYQNINAGANAPALYELIIKNLLRTLELECRRMALISLHVHRPFLRKMVIVFEREYESLHIAIVLA